jgi:hypothetical protein
MLSKLQQQHVHLPAVYISLHVPRHPCCSHLTRACSCKHAGHPEHPNRIKELSSRLEREGLLGKCTRLTPKLVSMQSVAGFLICQSVSAPEVTCRRFPMILLLLATRS